jgi:hypothetical protein
MSRNFDLFSMGCETTSLASGTYKDFDKIPYMAALQIKMLSGGTLWLGPVGYTLATNATFNNSCYMMAVNEIQSFNLSGGLRVFSTGADCAFAAIVGKTANS